MSFTEGTDSTALADQLNRLVPGVAIHARASGGVLRRWLRSSAAQMGDMAVLDVGLGPGPGAGRLTVRVSDRPDLVVANVAAIVSTTVDVRRTFGSTAAHINEISFDRAETGFRSNRVAGTAHTSLGQIHYNANLVLPPGGRGRVGLEAVAAHECWHQIEHVFELQRFTESMAFRRSLGEHFGVETLEQALTGRERGAPPAHRTAYERLRTEVSAYAATNVREATAEMMMIWWCSRGAQPPIGILFDRLMAQHFDVHRG